MEGGRESWVHVSHPITMTNSFMAWTNPSRLDLKHYWYFSLVSRCRKRYHDVKQLLQDARKKKICCVFRFARIEKKKKYKRVSPSIRLANCFGLPQYPSAMSGRRASQCSKF